MRFRIVVLPEPFPPYRIVIGDDKSKVRAPILLTLFGKIPKGYRFPLLHFRYPSMGPVSSYSKKFSARSDSKVKLLINIRRENKKAFDRSGQTLLVLYMSDA